MARKRYISRKKAKELKIQEQNEKIKEKVIASYKVYLRWLLVGILPCLLLVPSYPRDFVVIYSTICLLAFFRYVRARLEIMQECRYFQFREQRLYIAETLRVPQLLISLSTKIPFLFGIVSYFVWLRSRT